MEKSESYLIAKHFSDLVVHTSCSVKFLTFMRDQNVLSFRDIDVINGFRDESGKAHKFYTIIQTRRKAFSTLLDALRRTKQDKILHLLTRGRLPETVYIPRRTESILLKCSDGIMFNVRPADAVFSGRYKELRALHQKIVAGSLCAHKICTIVISGVGGIGKTQICRKYVEMHKQDFRDNAIWINGETERSLEKSFFQLSNVLKIARQDVNGKELEIEALVDMVYQYLEKRRYLLIFNNVENCESLNKFLPMSRVYPEESLRPTVLMTSRETEWGPWMDVMKLSELEQHAAVQMVQKGLGDSQKDAICLATGLQFFPLAIRLAVACIRQQRVSLPTYTIAKFLKDFEKRRKEMMSFHSSDVCAQLASEYFIPFPRHGRLQYRNCVAHMPRTRCLLVR